MKGYLLGFDIRINKEKLSGQWSEQHRQQYLMRPEIQYPLTADPRKYCWPSVFGAKERPEDTDRFYVEDGCFFRPDAQTVSAFWQPDDPDHLLAFISYDDLPQIPENWIFNRDHVAEIDPPPHWQELGYDVVDYCVLSGLFNCAPGDGIDPEDRAKWGPLLNEYGLFSSLEAARAFRDHADQSIEEHAPFYVIHMFMIEDLEPDLHPLVLGSS